jgi:hypothetical protein
MTRIDRNFVRERQGEQAEALTAVTLFMIAAIAIGPRLFT